MAKKSRAKDRRHKKEDTPKFIKGMLYDTLIYLCLGVIFMGSIGVYMTKIAQSNVLPDSADSAPYDNVMPDVQPINIDSNVLRQYDWHGLGWMMFHPPTEQVSQSVHFDFTQVLDTYYMGMYGKLIENTHSNFLLYFRHVFDTTLSVNNMGLNALFRGLGYVLPEWAIMLVFPAMAHFAGLLFAVVTLGTTVFAHIYNIPDLFLQKEADGVTWQDYKSIKYFKLKPLLTTGLFLMVSLWSVLAVVGASLAAIVATPFTVSYFAHNDSDNKKPKSVMQYIADMVKHKYQFLLIIVSFITLSNAYKHLGDAYTAGALIATIVAVLYNVFVQQMPNPETDDTFHALAQTRDTTAKKLPGRPFDASVVDRVMGVTKPPGQ